MNEKALSAFMEKMEENKGILSSLEILINNNLNADPEKINWGHVGNAGHVNELLKQIQDFLG